MKPRLSKLEFQIMETLWTEGQASIREMREAFPEESRPAYTTVQTMVYRLEAKGAVKRLEKVGSFHMFAPAISRVNAHKRMIDDFLAFFGGRSEPVMAHLIESGKFTLADVKTAEKTLLALSRNKGKSKAAGSGEAKPRGTR
jgi:BlaI family transcriptional regulator, penicillinase repressor